MDTLKILRKKPKRETYSKFLITTKIFNLFYIQKKWNTLIIY